MNREGQKKIRTDAERMAREELERLQSHPLSDSEWIEQRNRLIEFVQTLARWDVEQRNHERGASDSLEKRMAS